MRRRSIGFGVFASLQIFFTVLGIVMAPSFVIAAFLSWVVNHSIWLFLGLDNAIN